MMLSRSTRQASALYLTNLHHWQSQACTQLPHSPGCHGRNAAYAFQSSQQFYSIPQATICRGPCHAQVLHRSFSQPCLSARDSPWARIAWQLLIMPVSLHIQQGTYQANASQQMGQAASVLMPDWRPPQLSCECCCRTRAQQEQKQDPCRISQQRGR